jgi:hypothetical protein
MEGGEYLLLVESRDNNGKKAARVGNRSVRTKRLRFSIGD